ncbi:MAG: type II toxin-antitoxin system VapB family antitoxin, partial [Phycisphaerae bacterium]
MGRTNIVIDDDLMDEALKVSRLKTKKDAVEEGLKLLVQRKKQESIKDLRGKLHWK